MTMAEWLKSLSDEELLSHLTAFRMNVDAVLKKAGIGYSLLNVEEKVIVKRLMA